MSSARSINFGPARVAQLRHVLVLAIALCVWILAYASHLHTGDEHDQAKPSCSFCLMLPASAAPPPVILQVPTLVSQACGVACDRIRAIVTRDLPSSYLSRAPPSL